MKFQLLRLLIMAIKYSTYGLILQVMCMGILFAHSTNAQYSSVKETHLNSSFHNKTLQEAFDLIEKKTDFAFYYNQKDLDKSLKLNIPKKNGHSVAEVLFEISKQARLKFKQVNNNISVTRIDPNSDISDEKTLEVVFLADVEISGKITDENGDGLPGASVVVKGTTTGTTTDLDGNYKLTVSEQSILTVSFVGYKTSEIIVGSQSIVDVQMKLDAAQLEEIVVVGYGTAKKGDLTGAVATVSTKDFDRIPATTPLQALQGRAPGIQISTRSGLPGDGAEVLVRGTQSINGSNSPIFVVDGVITSGINNINPSNIESVSVLKDASAAAIYGARAANGVILVTTKRGIGHGDPEISFRSYYGIQTESNLKLKLLNSSQFLELWTESYTNAGLDIPWDDQALANYNGVDTNWKDLMLQTGIMQNYDISVAGGSEKSNYYIAGGYLSEKGMIIETGFKKYTLSFNSDHRINNRIKFGNSLNIYATSRKGNGNYYTLALRKSPLTKAFEDNGDYGRIINSNLEHIHANPVYLAKNTTDLINAKGLQGNMYLTVNILKGLQFTARGSMDYSNSNETNFSPGVAPIYGWEGSVINSITKENKENVHWISDFLFNYSTIINERHSIKALIGYSLEENQNENLKGSRTGTPNDDIKYLNAGDPLSQLNGNGFSDWAFASVFGRLNYTFNNKYLLTATVRRDGTSRLGKENRFGVFPSASIAYRISEEGFLKNSGFIKDLKVRASYGKLGNVLSVSNYGTIAALSVKKAVLNQGGAQGYTLSSAVNSSLKWESASKKNIGIDAELLEGKLYSTIDYFIEDTNDLLFSDPIPRSTGLSGSPRINAGQVRNKGIEFELGYRIEKSDWSYDVSFNMTHVKNKVVDLEGRDLRTSGLIEGFPVNSFFGYKANGIVTDAGQLDIYSSGGFTNKGIGDIALLDIDGHDADGNLTGIADGKVDAADRTIIGNKYPNLIYGLFGTVNYKNWSVQIQAQGVQGVDLDYSPSSSNDLIVLMSSWARNEDARVLNRYHAENNPNGTWPKLSKSQTGSNDTFSEFWLEDASYLRLKNVNLNYNVVQNVCDKLGLGQLGFYISVQNAFTFTNFSGPEVDTTSDPLTGVPQPRTWILGLKAIF